MLKVESKRTTATSNHKLLIAAAQELPQDPEQAALTIGWMENPNKKPFEVMGMKGPIDRTFKRTKFDFPYAIEIAKRANNETFDAVIALRDGTGYPLALLKKAGLLRPTLVIINHGAANPGPFGVKKHFVKAVKDQWDMMVCLSPSEKQTFLDLYKTDPSKVTSVMLPYNTDYFRPLPPNIPTQERILSTGVSHRDYSTLIEAMRLLDNGRNHPQLVIDAYSPSDPLKNRSWDEDLPSNVRKEHFPDPSSFRMALGTSRFAALAIDAETGQGDAGCTLAQAAASMEKPIVASSEGLKEYIIDNVTGLRVPAGDTYALAQAIKEVWYNDSLRTKLGRHAREFALTTFSREAWTRNIRDLVESLN